MKLKQNKKDINPFKGIFVILETMARVMIVIVVLYILGTKITPTTFQLWIIDIAIMYWTAIPTIDLIKEIFCNDR